MSIKEKHQSIAVHSGAEIGRKFASACHRNYLQKIAEGSISAENCPETVVFNLAKLKSYLNQLEHEFEKSGVPENNRGVAVTPMMYAGEKQFNIMFVPCRQDESGNAVHLLSSDDGDTSWDFSDGWPPIWNHGSGI
jgi:hypothetical protein